MALRVAIVQPERLVAETLDEAQRVRDQQNGPVATPELRELVEALVREAFVANRQDLVDQQHVRIHVDGDCKAQTHVHARRIRFHRGIDELAQLGEIDDLVEALFDLTLGETEHDPVDEHIFTTGNLRVKTGAELDERRNAAGHFYGA